MTLQQILSFCRAQGIVLRLEDGNIRVNDPNKAVTAPLVGAIKANKDKLIALLSLSQNSAAQAVATRLTPSDFPNAEVSMDELAALEANHPAIERLYIATPMQSGMIFHGLMDDSGSSYTTQMTMDIGGELNLSAFKAAWQAAAERHAIFRTSFVGFEFEQLHQLVHREVQVPFIERDLRGLDDDALTLAVDQYCRQDKAAGFDFSAAPLMRLSVLRTGEQRYVVVWSHHHVLLDGWCLPIVMQQVMNDYRRLCLGERPAQDKQNIPYESYIGWLKGRSAEKARQFWAQHLTGIEAVNTLALDPELTARPSAVEYHERLIHLGDDTTAAVERLAASLGCTVNAVVQGVWAYWLYRINGEHSVVFGNTVSGRPPEVRGIESMVGLFINTIPVALTIGGDMTVAELIKRLHSDNLARDEYAYLALADIQQLSQASDARSLFDTLLVFENYPVDTSDAVGAINNDSDNALELSFRETREQTNYALTLKAHHKAQLSLSLGFSNDRFAAGAIDKVLKQLQGLFEQLTTVPSDTPLSSLRLLDKDSIARLSQGMAPLVDYRPQCLGRYFERQAQATPHAPALKWLDAKGQENVLSYQQLDAQANRLARHLIATGVTPESFVLVMLSRGPSLVTAILAILKAGGAYVPLDPKYPQERVEFIVADSAAKVVVSESDFAGLFAATDCRLLLLDDAELNRQLDTLSGECVDVPGLSHDNLSHVIYTSGSTGLPKGTLIAHANVAALLQWADAEFSPEQRREVLFGTSVCFDLSVFELWATWYCGGCVVVCDSPLDLLEQPKLKPTLINTVPSVAQALLDSGYDFDGVQVVNLAGEALKAPLVSELYQQQDIDAVYNLYGPSEDTTYSTYARIDRQVPKVPPIGKPVFNTWALVMNDAGIVPPGCLGELYLAGDGLARGYHNRQALTDERFVSLAAEAVEGLLPDATRFYRTGDLVRWQDDGELSYIGRNDSQVKVSGFRIELGEIENALAALASVKDCAVLALERVGGKQLVAFVEPFAAGSADQGAIREALKGQLPYYMVPQEFIVLDALPRTPNGKIDRKPLPQLAQHGEMAAGVAPRNALESSLQQLFATVLGLEGDKMAAIGIHNDFFALGGHSISASRLMALVNRRFERALPLRSLFEQPTIAGLAGLLAAEQNLTAPVTIGKAPLDSAIPLSFAQQRLWFIDKLEQDSRQYNLTGALAIERTLDGKAFDSAAQQLLKRHPILATVYGEQDDEPVQLLLDSAELAIEHIDLSALDADAQAEQIALHQQAIANHQFDLSAELPIRVMLLTQAEQRHLLLLCVHHIAADGHSMALLSGDFEQLYFAAISGVEANLPPIEVQYGDYAYWQRQYMAGERLSENLSYWQQQLAGIPAVHGLVLDQPRPARQKHSGQTVQKVADQALYQPLNQVCREHSVTPFMLLHSAFAVLLGGESRCDDIVTGTPVSGRFDASFEAVVGMFVNTLALRTRLTGSDTFATLLSRAKQHLMGAFDHQHLPFEVLVDALNPERSMAHAPLFQILFSYEKVDSSVSGSDHLAAAKVKLAQNTSQFDISLTAVDDGKQLGFIWNYDDALFGAATIERLADGLCRVLAMVAGNAYLTVQALQQPKLSANLPQTLPQAFAEAAAKHPERPALTDGTECFGYGQLQQQAQALAAGLSEAMPGKTGPVAVVMTPSMTTPRLLLGVLQSGATLLPLPGSIDGEQLQGLCQAHKAAFVLSDGEGVRAFEGLAGVELVDYATLTKPGAAVSVSVSVPAPVPAPSAETIAVVLAGDNGEVTLSQRALLQHLMAMAEKCRLSELDVVALMSDEPDLALFETLAPLLIGARQRVVDSHNLAQLAAERELTLAKAKPALTALRADSIAQWSLGAADFVRLGQSAEVVFVAPLVRLYHEAHKPAIAQGEAVAPRNAVEQQLVAIWQQVLRRSDIGIYDDFFDLGGHSLLATRVVNRIREQFAVNLKLRDLFEATSIAALAQVVDSSSAQSEQTIDAAPLEAFTASYAQRRLWFLDQLESGSAQYNMPCALTFDGEFCVETFERAVAALIDKHPILRARFVEQDSDVLCLLDHHGVPSIHYDDFSALTAEECREAVARRVKTNVETGFDLAADWLIRFSVVKLGRQAHLVLFNMHHIISDGASIAILRQDFAELYGRLSQNSASEAPSAGLHYGHFAEWQRETLAGEALEQQLSFWRERLKDAPTLHGLPLDFARPAQQRFEGKVFKSTLSSALSGHIERYCREHKVTPFMLLHSAFSLLLARYSGKDDVVVGTPVAGRVEARWEKVMGLFVNTLALRSRIDWAQGFDALVQQNRQTLLDAFEHQQVPFEMVVDDINPERSLSYSPLLQILFTVQKAAKAQDEAMSELEAEDILVKLDLELEVLEGSDDYTLVWKYNRHLFAADTIERMAANFAVLLQGVLADHRLAVGDVALLSDEQKQQLCVGFNDTQAAFPQHQPVHQAFELKAAQQPQAIALTFEGQSMTYAELNIAANRLAHRLLSQGLKQEDIVGLYFERSMAMVVAIVAVLKAGGAYLPLDPSMPAARTCETLADAEAFMLLSMDAQAQQLGSLPCPLLTLDQDIEGEAHWCDNPALQGIGGQSLAYVIYTSGSTGKPKGVLVEHRALVNRLNWMQRAYPIDERDTVLQKTPYGFDVSVWEFLWPLRQGARLCIARPQGHQDPLYLAQLMVDAEVSVMHFVPSMLRAFLNALPARHFDALKWVFCSGEALAPDTVRDYIEGQVGGELINLYGPTEAAIDVSFWDCARYTEMPVCIGRPIDNIELHVVDDRQNLLPIGAVGELLIGGVGLARGYHQRPELTAEKFIELAVDGGQARRFYRSGDLVRRLSGGELEYIGRLDSQIKLRGLRIELGEIEAALGELDGVDQAAVLVAESRAGAKQLVGYVTRSDDAASDDDAFVADIAASLAKRLPEYMIPAHIELLAQMPLGATGKLDRKALPAIGFESPTSEQVAPRNDIEAALCGLWQQVLGLENVGIFDNFFALGGDSILCIQIIAKAKPLGMSLTVRDIFECKTIAALAPRVGNVALSDAVQSPESGRFELTPIQRAFLADVSEARHHYNQSILLQSVDAESMDQSRLKKALKAVIDRHDMLRAVMQFDGERVYGEYLQDSEQVLALGYRSFDLSGLSGEAQNNELTRCCEQLQGSFELSKGPLFKAAWFDLGQGQSRLLLLAHHFVVDGVSWRVLLADLSAAWQQVSNDAEADVVLAPKTSSFAKWSEALSAHAKDPQTLDEKAYWLGMLRGIPTLGFKTPQAGGSGVLEAQLGVDAQTTEALLGPCNDAYRTQTNELLLAALCHSFLGWSGLDAMNLAMEGHGRVELFERLDLSETVGWFTVMYPLVLTPNSPERWDDTIKTAKETLRGVPNQGIGYGVLKHLCRDGDINALAVGERTNQVVFNYLGQIGSGNDAGPFAIAHEDKGRDSAAEQPVKALLSVNALVAEGRLRLAFSADARRVDQASLDALTRRFGDALEAMTRHCREAIDAAELVGELGNEETSGEIYEF